MTVNPYAPPSAAVGDPVEPPIPRPRRVTVAMLLLCIAVAMSVILVIIQHRIPIVGQIALRLGVTGGLCLAIAARRNWARWVFSAFVGFSWLAVSPYLTVLVHQPVTATVVATTAIEVLELVALLLLFTGPSGRWFRQSR